MFLIWIHFHSPNQHSLWKGNPRPRELGSSGPEWVPPTRTQPFPARRPPLNHRTGFASARHLYCRRGPFSSRAPKEVVLCSSRECLEFRSERDLCAFCIAGRCELIFFFFLLSNNCPDYLFCFHFLLLLALCLQNKQASPVSKCFSPNLTPAHCNLCLFVCLFTFLFSLLLLLCIGCIPTWFNMFCLEKPENLHDIILWLSLKHLGFGADFLI